MFSEETESAAKPLYSGYQVVRIQSTRVDPYASSSPPRIVRV